MRPAFTISVVLAILVAVLATATTSAAPARLTATVKPPPEVQLVGVSYTVKITVRPHGTPMLNFCIDFEDDDGSWLVRMPSLKAYDDDVFCTAYLPGKKKTFVARIVPANPGVHTLQVGVGHADLFPATNAAILDERSLWWQDDFVLR